MRDDRGSHGRSIGDSNRARIRAFFLSHVGCTNSECSQALNLSIQAVGRHLLRLREEWK